MLLLIKLLILWILLSLYSAACLGYSSVCADAVLLMLDWQVHNCMEAVLKCPWVKWVTWTNVINFFVWFIYLFTILLICLFWFRFSWVSNDVMLLKCADGGLVAARLAAGGLVVASLLALQGRVAYSCLFIRAYREQVWARTSMACWKHSGTIYSTATASISTSTPKGNSFTATHDLAGLWVLKYLA